MIDGPEPTVTRLCCRCGDAGPTVTAVGAVEAASGPGWTAYACAPCVPWVRVTLDPPV